MNQEVTQYQKNLTNTKGEILFTLNCLVVIATPIVISILSNKYPLYQSHMLILSDMLPLTISTIYYPLMLYIIAPELRRFILKCWNIPIFKSIELLTTSAQKKVHMPSFRTRLLKYGFCNKVISERWNSYQLNTFTTYLSAILGMIAT